MTAGALATESRPDLDAWAAYAEEALDAAEVVAARTAARVGRYALGPVSIAVEIVGAPEYRRRLLQALAGAVADDGKADYRVIAIDGAAPGSGLAPRLAWRPPGRELSMLHRMPERGLSIRYHPELGSWRILSVERRLAVNWAADAVAVPDWEDGFPFRNLIHWMSFGAPWSMVHAAAIGRNGSGVLLVGAGGSGKSTTTAAAVLAGYATVGDDFVLVSLPENGAPQAHLVYDCLRFDERSLALLPDYRGTISNPTRSAGQKSQMHLTEHLPDRLTRELALKAIVVPHVSHSGTTRLSPAAEALALKAILPSTAFLLSGGGPELTAKLSSLSRRLPVYALEIGGTPAEAVAALEPLITG